FAERARREPNPQPPSLEGKGAGGLGADAAAIDGARHRLRPILMTSCAMIAGMLPMALGLGEAGQQVAPLGRAVIGGLLAGTATTLLIVPALFSVVQGWTGRQSVSLDPDDAESPYYDPLTKS